MLFSIFDIILTRNETSAMSRGETILKLYIKNFEHKIIIYKS